MVQYFDTIVTSFDSIGKYIIDLTIPKERINFNINIKKIFYELDLSMVYRIKGHYQYKKKEVNSENKIQKKV